MMKIKICQFVIVSILLSLQGIFCAIDLEFAHWGENQYGYFEIPSGESPDLSLDSTNLVQNQTEVCGLVTTKGRRSYQEDRVVCDLHFNIAFPAGAAGQGEDKQVRVAVVAVFDGHIGQEASEMASSLFLDYFRLNTMVAMKEREEPVQHRVILKEALVKTIEVIDLKFSQIAKQEGLYSGTTAVITLLVDGQILVANVGDSKALLCSEELNSNSHPQVSNTPAKSAMDHLFAKELTRDHTAHIAEERARISTAGGSILDPIFGHGVPLINGHFPMTRAIGDVPLKRYGIIAVPEVTDWLPLTAKEKYLVVSTDGIFESLTPQSVCDILQSKEQETLSCTASMVDFIVKKAYEKGSHDNLSVVVVSLT